jgi:polysaccharide pyruvyl transferase WcaK-like protein
MRNPYFASRPGSAGFADRNVLAAFQRSGNNLGNQLFFSGVRRAIVHRVPSSSIRVDPKYVRQKHDGIIIPAANWLQPKSDYGQLATLIERADLPAVIVGIGAQSFDGSIPELSEGMLRLLHVVSERSKAISVRGAFSAEVLEHYGIKNVVVTGCPSLLWHGERPARIERSASVEKVSVSGTRSDTDARLLRNEVFRIGLHITRMAYRLGLDYVAQTEVSDIRIAARDIPDITERRAALKYLQKVYDTDDRKALSAYLIEHVRYFFNIGKWVDYSRGVDLTFGTRLHGTIAALLAGRAALLIIHDTRTREMAEQAGISTIDAHEVLAHDIPFPELAARVDVDLFNRKQETYYANFARFFELNDIAHKLLAAASVTPA